MPTVKKVIFTEHKHLLAGADRLLIDDYADNCIKWDGPSVTWSQPWNSNTASHSLIIDSLEEML